MSAPSVPGKLTLTQWLEERADNCARICRLKDDGVDKRLWREDESYFRAAIRACEALEKIATVGNTDRQIKNAVTGNMEGTAHLSPGGHAQCRMIARAALSCSAPQVNSGGSMEKES